MSTLGRGLPNLGNTCYINSIIQCLRYSKNLVYMLKPHNNSKDTLLVKSLIELFYANSPVHYLHVFIKELNKTPEFKIMRQCDAHELFLYLTDSLFTQLKDYKNPFTGQLKSTVQCSVCSTKSNTQYPFASISVQMPLLPCNVDELLTDFCKPEVLNDLIECEHCKIKTKSSKQLHVTPGKLLAIHLKRFNGMNKIYTEVRLQENIRIGTKNYMLYASCNHSGNSFGGHYTASCMKRDGSWILLNDKHVANLSCIPDKSDRPYILFYVQI